MKSTPWWGAFDIAESHTLLFGNNAFMLAVEHKPKEWCIQVHRNKTPDIEFEESEFTKHIGEFCLLDNDAQTRHIVSQKTTRVEIKPCLADRTVVCRPISPITVAPGASVIIYLSTPIWISIGLHLNNDILLREIATQQLSDTWFGPSTREGEFCYASQTNGRLDVDKLHRRVQRAITPLKIENNADSDLHFERVALPVPTLSIYTSDMGQLWTENVSLIREDDGGFAKLKLGHPPVDSTLVSGPRVELEHGKLVRAFSAIFG